MKTIHKYQVYTYSMIQLPLGARVLSVVAQDNMAFIYALIDMNEKRTVLRQFYSYSTGDKISESPNLTFIGTVCLYGWMYCHFFESIEPEHLRVYPNKWTPLPDWAKP